MRKVKGILRDGVIVPDLAEGEPWPGHGKNDVTVVATGMEYVVYETGDELPEFIKHRPKLSVLRESLSDSQCLWRYMDVARFYSLLTKRALYFCPAFILREQEPYELRTPITQYKEYRDNWNQLFTGEEGQKITYKQNFDELAKEHDSHLLSMHGISCWSMSSQETNALWRLFIPNGVGVAVKTSLGRLKQAIDPCRPIWADKVEYIDYTVDRFAQHPNAVGFDELFHKAVFYEYESEFRMVTKFSGSLYRYGVPPRSSEEAFAIAEGADWGIERFVPVNLELLIEEIVISPLAPQWLDESIRHMVQQNCHDSLPIRRSQISSWPDPSA